jgi:hypothetical protein
MRATRVRTWKPFLLTALTALLWGCGDGPLGSRGDPVTGLWGGEGVMLDADASSANLTIGCALGHVPHGLRVDENGEFSMRGVVAVSLAPPTRAFAATYRGRVVGDTMTLNVELAPGGPEIVFTPFTLVRDRPAEMPLCALR